jgi:hypothetical protein
MSEAYASMSVSELQAALVERDNAMQVFKDKARGTASISIM